MPSARMLSVVLACALLAAGSSLQAETPLPIMPLPAHAVEGSGSFPIDGGFQIVFEGAH